jgi:acyl-CoA synthetase (AMP-forming)/AMP-acid ligase II
MTSSSETANIASALTEMARLRPYATAVACPAGRDRAGRAAYTFQTFRQLDRESDVLARGLTAAKIGPRVRTALMVRPGHEFFALTFALFKAGAVPVLIDPGIGLKSLGKCLDDACPGAFVGIPAAQAVRRVLGWAKGSVEVAVTVRPDDGRGRVPPLPDMSRRERKPPRYSRVLEESAKGAAGGPDLGRGHVINLSLAQVRRAGLDAEDAPFEAVPPSPDGLDAILFTSGSTGPPKGVVYSHAIFAAQVAMLRDLYRIEPGEIDLCTFPLFALFAPALGMTSIIPVMDATRPARVDPSKIVDAVETFGVSNLFGSPALLRRVGAYGASRGVKLPTLRRVISAGAPVSARVIEDVVTMLAPGVQVFTPYGATESLPVCSIGSDEILGETRHATDRGAGVCVGRPVPGMRAEIMHVTEDAVAAWSDDRAVPDGTVGEIVVQGPVVTREYFENPEATLRAKMAPSSEAILPGWDKVEAGVSDAIGAGMHVHYWQGLPGPVWHRMGDLGYRDDKGRLWFCGRKAHRVLTAEGTLYTIPCEAVFNTHPEVARTALVGVGRSPLAKPVLCVEPKDWGRAKREFVRLRRELLAIGEQFPHTRSIGTILFHPAFPVDVRHNAKIFREKLAGWAARRVR